MSWQMTACIYAGRGPTLYGLHPFVTVKFRNKSFDCSEILNFFYICSLCLPIFILILQFLLGASIFLFVSERAKLHSFKIYVYISLNSIIRCIIILGFYKYSRTPIIRINWDKTQSGLSKIRINRRIGKN